MRILLLFICVIMLAGCFSIPSGNAPVGSIVAPELTKKEYSRLGAKNYLITSLSMFALQHFPKGAKLNVDFKNLSARAKSCSLDVVCAVRNSVPLQVAKRSEADYRVTGKFNKENVWSMSFRDLKTKKIVWHEQVTIKE